MLEWVAIFFSRGSSWPRDWTHVSCIVGGYFTILPAGKSQELRREALKSQCSDLQEEVTAQLQVMSVRELLGLVLHVLPEAGCLVRAQCWGSTAGGAKPGGPLALIPTSSASTAPCWQNLTESHQSQGTLTCHLQRPSLCITDEYVQGKVDGGWITADKQLVSLLPSRSGLCTQGRLQALVFGCLSSICLLDLIGFFFLSNLLLCLFFKFKFKKFFFFFFYNVVLISAIQQRKSVIIIHTFLPP